METKKAPSLRSGKPVGSFSLDEKIRCLVAADSALASQVIGSNSEECSFVADYSIEKDYGEKQDASITVVTRTQGKRMDLLRETFLCLSAQTDRRFRVLLVEHKVSCADKGLIRSLVEELPEWLQERVAVVSTDSGGRSHPLNIGFSVADTDYAVILDDDDLVFDNWIESFLVGIDSYYGEIIHSGTYTQKWERGHSARGDFYRAIDSPLPGYCERFDYLKQLNCNYCPTMGLAYPLFIFRVFGICFDESLNTVEDWDFLMRAVRICGVCDVDRRTAIYRLWSSGENSHSLHNEVEWEISRQQVQERLNKLPIVFPPGYYCRIAETFDVFQDVRFDAKELKVFAVGHDEANKVIGRVRTGYSVSSQLNLISFDLDGSEVKEIGIDLRTAGRITLSDLEMRVKCADDTELVFDMYDLCGNYYCSAAGKMGFIASCPHFKVVLPSFVRVESCSVTFKYRNYVEEALLTGTKLRLRVERKAKRIKRKLMRRIG